MGDSNPVLPFELVYRGKGSWRARWVEEKLFIEVSGAEEAPAASLVETLRGVVSTWSEVRRVIADWAAGLASDAHVPLDPPTIGGFAARTCRFDEPLVFNSISVCDADAPHRFLVSFYTGYPDGYATFEVVLEHGVPVSISAYAS